MTFILLTLSPRSLQLWMSLSLSPISAPLGNSSAWQQPFWERISEGHTDLLNFELECTHTKTHIYIHMLKSRHANTLWLMPVTLRISYQTHTVCMSVRDTGEAEAVSLKSNQPPLALSALMSLAHHTRSHTPSLTSSPHTNTLSLSLSQPHTHSSSITMNIVQYSKQRSHDTL